jgi:Family of unknown function (DUF5681)
MPTLKFKSGQSGNPNGRPKDKTPATLIRKAVADEMPTIIQTIITAAKNGDMQACKVLLDRICPPLKALAQPISVATGSSLTETGTNVINATLAGDVPPDIGSHLITALTNQVKLIELQELTERLTRLEKQLERQS